MTWELCSGEDFGRLVGDAMKVETTLNGLSVVYYGGDGQKLAKVARVDRKRPVEFFRWTLLPHDRLHIAATRREWHKGIAIASLRFDTSLCCFEVIYQEQPKFGDCQKQRIPGSCTVNWLGIFVRNQATLQPNSHYVVDHPSGVWRAVILKILAEKDHVLATD